MQLSQLEHFVVVADELHFTRAAARVHLAQSSLSSSIRALERELGEDLFLRDNKRVALTAAGRTLLPHARLTLASAATARDAVAGLDGELRGQLLVGAIQTFGRLDLGKILVEYRRRHPHMRIRLVHDAAPALAQAIVDAELDIAFVDGPVDHRRLTARALGHDALVLAVPSGDPLANRDTVHLGDPALRDRDFVDYRADSALQAQVDRACRTAGLARSVACEAPNMQYLVELVEDGMGVAVVPPAALRGFSRSLVGIPIRPALRRTLVAVMPRLQRQPATVQALLDLIDAHGG